MELYEFPNEMPIATRCAGSACALILAVCVVCVRVVRKKPSGEVRLGAVFVCAQLGVSRVCRVGVEFSLGRARNTVFEFLTSAPPQTSPAVADVQESTSRAR